MDRPWTLPVPSTQVWLALVGIALFSTALAYILYFRILATAGATNLLLVTFLLPVSAMGLGVFVLGEQVTWPALAGMALIGLGLAAIDGRLWRAIRVACSNAALTASSSPVPISRAAIALRADASSSAPAGPVTRQ